MNYSRSILPGLRSPFERIESRQLGQHAVLTLPRDGATWGQTRSAFRTKSDPVASGFLHVAGLQSDLGAVDLAVDLVVAVDETDVLGLGAAFERTGATA
jgi:hypothetical protein